MTALTLANLQKKYQGNKAFQLNIPALSVEEGQIVALLGESGCGKTTLLRLIAGLEMPDAGIITIGNQAVAQGKGQQLPPEKRGIGMVFQDYALFPHITVAQNVAYGISKLPTKEVRTQEMLALVGLESLADRYPHQLSGGQQQRVALARALANKPALLLLDEPFSNLDESLKNQVRNDLRAILKKAQATAIFVTHDTKDALAMADHIVLMRQGSVAQEGAPKQLYQQPANRYVANYFGEVNWLDGWLENSQFHTEGLSFSYTSARHGQAQLGIRPAHIGLWREGLVLLQATVRQTAFMGDWLMVEAVLPTGTVVQSMLLGSHSMAIGSHISLGFSALDAFLCD